ncbi:MAG: redoxin domain-containing protein [Acidobacteria bacterium]|nr:redoxin domain-containing protein [Acidobacteriota bacterium]
MILALLTALVLQQAAAPANDHEYTDLLKIKASEIYNKYVSEHQVSEADKKELRDLFQFKDFIGKAMDGRMVNFHSPKDPGYKPAKVLIMSYVAEWCKNCNYEAPYLRDLYHRYKSRGLEIVARSEYSEVEKMKAVIEKHQTPYPVITGSVIAYNEREKIRLETFQYLLRSTLGDKRKWGTPFSIIVINGDLENPYVVLGEMKSEQVNELIERSLGTN